MLILTARRGRVRSNPRSRAIVRKWQRRIGSGWPIRPGFRWNRLNDQWISVKSTKVELLRFEMAWKIVGETP